jgi:hypothetical protein
MHQPYEIQNHTAVRRAALAEGKSVLAQLDRRGNTAFNVMPIVFDTAAELRAYRDSHTHQVFNSYYGSSK